MLAPEAESFLSTVQQYAQRKGMYAPEEGSPAWILVELFRPSVEQAIKRADAYHDRIRGHLKKMFRQGPPHDRPQAGKVSEGPLQVLHGVLWREVADTVATQGFKGLRHDDLLDRLRGILDAKLESVRTEILQSRSDAGCDLTVEVDSPALKCGVQLKSWRDIGEDGFARSTFAQIQESRTHGLQRLYVILCGDMTDRSQKEKVRQFLSRVSKGATTICASSRLSVHGICWGPIRGAASSTAAITRPIYLAIALETNEPVRNSLILSDLQPQGTGFLTPSERQRRLQARPSEVSRRKRSLRASRRACGATPLAPGGCRCRPSRRAGSRASRGV